MKVFSKLWNHLPSWRYINVYFSFEKTVNKQVNNQDDSWFLHSCPHPSILFYFIYDASRNLSLWNNVAHFKKVGGEREREEKEEKLNEEVNKRKEIRPTRSAILIGKMYLYVSYKIACHKVYFENLPSLLLPYLFWHH